MKTIAIVLLILLLLSPKLLKSSVANAPAPTLQPQHQIIERKAIVEALAQTSEIVGMNGVLTKEYEYSNKQINTGINWIDKHGESKYKFKFNVEFKTGFHTDDIGSIEIIGKEIYLNPPDIQLIAIDITDVGVESTNGFAARRLTEEERRVIFSQAHEQIKKEIMSDDTIMRKSKYSARKAVEILLMKLNGVEAVKWRE